MPKINEKAKPTQPDNESRREKELRIIKGILGPLRAKHRVREAELETVMSYQMMIMPKRPTNLDRKRPEPLNLNTEKKQSPTLFPKTAPICSGSDADDDHTDSEQDTPTVNSR